MGSERVRLTKRAIDALITRARRELQPGERRPLKVRDADDGRLSARAWRGRDGNVTVSFWLRYFVAGRERNYRLGTHGEITIEEARAKARKVGDDPAAQRDEQRRRDRVGSTVIDLLRRYVADRERRGLAPKTLSLYRSMVDGTEGGDPDALVIARTDLGRIETHKLTREDVKRFHADNHHRPMLANHAVSLMRAAYGWAEIEPNPCRLRRNWKYPGRARRRYYTDAELGRFGAALTTSKEPPEMVAYLRCLLLTGARPTELLRLKWVDVDFDAGRINLRDSKTGEADPRAVSGIAITPPVEQVLRSLKPLDDNPHVFGSRRVAGAPLHDYRHAWRRLAKAAGVTGQDAVAYTARHTLATNAASMLPLNVVSGLLGHRSPGTTKRYSHDRGDAISRGAATVAAAIAAKLGTVVR
jgi:integrase